MEAEACKKQEKDRAWNLKYSSERTDVTQQDGKRDGERERQIKKTQICCKK